MADILLPMQSVRCQAALQASMQRHVHHPYANLTVYVTCDIAVCSYRYRHIAMIICIIVRLVFICYPCTKCSIMTAYCMHHGAVCHAACSHTLFDCDLRVACRG